VCIGLLVDGNANTCRAQVSGVKKVGVDELTLWFEGVNL
jgi:hypothetical protein